MLVAAGCLSVQQSPTVSRSQQSAAPASPDSRPAAPQRLGSPPRALVAAAARHDELEDMALYFRVWTSASRDRADDAARTANTLLAKHPESIWVGPAQLAVGKVRRRTGDAVDARAWLTSARAALPASDRRATMASLMLAEIALDLNDDADAGRLALELRSAKPRGLVARRARRVADRLRERNPALLDDTASRLTEGELRLVEGDAAGALDEALAVLDRPVDPDQREEAMGIEARAEHGLGRRDRAQALCRALADRGHPTYGPKALANAARWRWNADDDAGAQRLFREVLERFPQSQEAADALYAIGRIQQESGQHAEAATTYTELARRFPLASTAQEARWRAGWVRFLSGDYRAAADTFDSLSSDSERDTRIASEYWEARSLEALGSPDAPERLAHVAERHPATYYGGLARDRLGEPSPPLPTAIDAARPPFPDTLDGPHAARARLLYQLGYRRLARLELDAMATTASTSDLLDAYSAIDAPGSALRLARTSPGARRHYLYPLGFWDVIRDRSAQLDLDPLLVTALVRQESLFVPEAVSPADAHGLMQLLPGTAREVAATRGMAAPDRPTLHRVEPNVMLGTALLRRLLDRYSGSTVRALAAYNAGEDAVAKWDHRYGTRPDDEFVELISYRETRDYVKSVLGHYEVYRQLYAAGDEEPRPDATSEGSPPKAPLDMMTMTSPGWAEDTR
jgi:soluble lytic murein transglycosylase